MAQLHSIVCIDISHPSIHQWTQWTSLCYCKWWCHEHRVVLFPPDKAPGEEILDRMKTSVRQKYPQECC